MLTETQYAAINALVDTFWRDPNAPALWTAVEAWPMGQVVCLEARLVARIKQEGAA